MKFKNIILSCLTSTMIAGSILAGCAGDKSQVVGNENQVSNETAITTNSTEEDNKVYTIAEYLQEGNAFIKLYYYSSDKQYTGKNSPIKIGCIVKDNIIYRSDSDMFVPHDKDGKALTLGEYSSFTDNDFLDYVINIMGDDITSYPCVIGVFSDSTGNYIGGLQVYYINNKGGIGRDPIFHSDWGPYEPFEIYDSLFALYNSPDGSKHCKGFRYNKPIKNMGIPDDYKDKEGFLFEPTEDEVKAYFESQNNNN